MCPEPVAAAVLITLPLSHYCEKARWALDRTALPYHERAHAPMLNRVAGGTVPVLVHGGRRFADSTGILVHADALAGGDILYPRDAQLRAEVDALEKRFDAELGPHTRRWVYMHLLPHGKLLRSLWARGVPRAEASLVPLIAPMARLLARASYKITPESGERSLQRVHTVFRDVEARLRDGRNFLVGERFTAADLTFACLAAPVLFPVGCRAVQPGLDEIPPAMREEILRTRESGAGRFATRMFAQERMTVLTTRKGP